MSFEIKDGVLVRCNDWSEDPRITEYTIPDGVTTIGKYAFLQHLYITKITLPEGLVSIEQGAFERCAELRTINRLPRKLTLQFIVDDSTNQI